MAIPMTDQQLRDAEARRDLAAIDTTNLVAEVRRLQAAASQDKLVLQLVNALRPFAEWYRQYDRCLYETRLPSTPLIVGDLQRASEAVKATEGVAKP